MWKKIVGPVVLVGLLWMAGGAFTTYYIMWLQGSLTRMLRESMSIMRKSGEMEAALWRLHSSVTEAGRYGRASLPADGVEAELVMERNLEALQRRLSTDDERQQAALIADKFAQYRSLVRQVFSQAESDGTGPMPTAIDETTYLAASVSTECKDFSLLEQRLLTESIDRHARLTNGVNALRLILFFGGPVLGVLVGVWITRSVRSSIHRLSVRLQDAALGVEKDLGHVDISPTGELPALEKQVQEVSARLSQAAGELERGRRDAERADRLAAAGELAAGIAHELRNPLTSLKLLIQTAARKHRDRPLNDKQFQILQDEITRMEKTIQSLLDLTRPPKMRRRLHNLCSTLRRSLNLVRSRANQHGVNILEGLPNERIMIQGDGEQLHQVFVNLLLNALEAMPDGGTLRIAIGGIAEDDTFCRIKCSDTGIGIPPDIIDRVFDPFVSGKEHGHGLGLAVSRRIVAEHGGTITAANRPEGGALFTVTMPFVSVEPESTPGSEYDLPVHRPTSDPEIAVHRPASDHEIAAQRPASDPDLPVQRPASDPELPVNRPASDPNLAVPRSTQ
jgi:signal transduction histidine kinase